MLILIAGITGSLGQRLAKVALSRGQQVRGLGRTPAKLAPEFSSQLESFVQSESYHDIPALEKALNGVDAVINAYAPDPILDLDGQLILLRAAERAGIKIFVASAWNYDWTNIKFGDFEYYNTKIALEHHVASTSSIKPVWILCGQFTDLLWTQYGPGGWDTTGDRPSKKYWGNGKSDRFSWITQDDCAEWTIDILLHGDGVLGGKGGIFKFHSGIASIEDLALVYEQVHSKKVDLVRQGSIEDLEARLAELRKSDRTGWFGYMTEAHAMVISKGQFVNSNLTVLDQFKEPTSLADALRAIKQ